MLIDQVADIKNLKKAWKVVKSGKTDDARRSLRGMDGSSIIKFEKNESLNLIKISEELTKGTYSIAPTKSYFRSKNKTKKYRLISPPCVQDAIVHAAILNVLRPLFLGVLSTDVSYSGVPKPNRKNRINHISALKQLHIEFSKKNYCVYESDIQGFFDSIVRERLFNKVKQNLIDDSLNKVIRDIIYFQIGNYDQLKKDARGKLPHQKSEVGIAQGSPLSPFFANVYLSDVDQIMYQLVGKRFFRYIDDFIIVAPTIEEAEELGGIIEYLLVGEGLALALEKTNLCNILGQKSFFTFLGLKISKYEIQQKKKQQEVLEIIQSNYLNTKKYKNVKSKLPFIDLVNAKIQGYANYYRTFHTQPMLRAINGLIRNMRKTESFKSVKEVDESGKKELMTIEKWQSAFS